MLLSHEDILRGIYLALFGKKKSDSDADAVPSGQPVSIFKNIKLQTGNYLKPTEQQTTELFSQQTKASTRYQISKCPLTKGADVSSINLNSQSRMDGLHSREGKRALLLSRGSIFSKGNMTDRRPHTSLNLVRNRSHNIIS